jgi:hypothetical protein
VDGAALAVAEAEALALVEALETGVGVVSGVGVAGGAEYVCSCRSGRVGAAPAGTTPATYEPSKIATSPKAATRTKIAEARSSMWTRS